MSLMLCHVQKVLGLKVKHDDKGQIVVGARHLLQGHAINRYNV